MFPTNFIEDTATESTTEDVGCDFVFDYDTGQHTITNGLLAECDTLQSIKQYIQNVLRTKTKAYAVYTKDETDIFGISVYDYLGQRSLPMGYINSELKREVTEQLTSYPLIASVTNWTGERERQGLKISFTVTLTDGSIINSSQVVSGYV